MEKKLQQRRTNALRCVVLFCMINYRKSNCFCLCTDVMGMQLCGKGRGLSMEHTIVQHMHAGFCPATVFTE